MLKTAAGLAVALALLSSSPVGAASVEYSLTIEKKTLSVTGKPAQVMTINGAVPGPVLRFTEGDIAKIRVQNAMDVGTSIHWHGILVPSEMDGVPFVSFPPIAPGETFTYEFPIRQSGTYWYHSHSEFQEQLGVYGAIVILPAQGHVPADRDYAVLFSDWTDEDPREVMRTLKRGSEWYPVLKRSGMSILGALRAGALGDYFRQELLRMPPMDISDIAYDRFLANGAQETELRAEPGETVRLRVIDGSSTTNFHLEFAGGPMTIIGADGQDVVPVEEKRLFITVAETYDVLVRVPASGAYEFRATAHDGSGHASVWIGSGERRPAADIPRPDLYRGMGHASLRNIFALTPEGAMGMPDGSVEAGDFDEPGMLMTEGMHAMHVMAQQASGHAVEHGPAGHPRHEGFDLLGEDASSHPDTALDGMDPRRPWSPYERLRAVRPTAFSGERPVREMRLTLDGDMERYVWSLNNRTLFDDDSILVRKGEILRFIMINRTMMHHPMHLHGHFFRVVNSQEDHAPLKHTVDVPPMSTTVIEFDANESGDWFFHCHLLYHMESGMARVVRYEGYDPGPAVTAIRRKLLDDHWFFHGHADLLSTMTEGELVLTNTRNILSLHWEAGWQGHDRVSWEGLLSWERPVNAFFSVFAGAEFQGTGGRLDDVRGVAGFRYLLPLNLEMRAWVDTDGGGRIGIGKEFHLTPRMNLLGECSYDTHDQWQGRTALSYMISGKVSLIGRWDSEYGWGAGLRVSF